MLELNFEKFPVLETARLVLKKITRTDLDALLDLRSNLDAMKYIDRPVITTMEMAEDLLKRINDGVDKNESIGWGMYLKAEPGLVGSIGFPRMEPEHYRGEVGYMLHPVYWRKGYTTEALGAVINYGFKMGLHSIQANINPDNEGSRRLLLNHGFVREAYFRENYYWNGKFLDTEIYSLLSTGNTGR